MAKLEKCYYCQQQYLKSNMRTVKVGLYIIQEVLCCQVCFDELFLKKSSSSFLHYAHNHPR